MEVHSHTHSNGHGTGRKKWRHYLWEFLMLFLAVFCGFLAENKREHMVEGQREKVYMKTLLDDLKNDSAAIAYSIEGNRNLQNELDTLVQMIDTIKISDQKQIINVYRIFYGWCYSPYIVTFSNRTISQLKSSGAMRLIHSHEVSDDIAFYYNAIEVCNTQATTYNEDVADLIRLSYKFFDKLYLRKGHENLLLAKQMLGENPAYLREFVNRADDLKEVINSYNEILITINKMAANLSDRIVKETGIKTAR